MTMSDTSATYSLHNHYGRINNVCTISPQASPSPSALPQTVEEHFDAEVLLKEQRHLLESSPAAEIRASPFLRFRLNAQQKFTMQHNQYLERCAQREASDRNPHPLTASATGLREQFTQHLGRQSISQGQNQSYQDGEGLCCSGCQNRFVDAIALNRHKSTCSEYAALVLQRRGSEKLHYTPRCCSTRETAVTPSNTDIRPILSIRERAEDPQPIPDVLTARGGHFSYRNQLSTHGGYQGNEGENAAAVAVFSPKAGSGSLSRSLPTPTSLREDMHSEFEARDTKHNIRARTQSRELTPPTPTSTWHQPSTSLRVTSIDEVPASVAARQSVDATMPTTPLGYQLGERFDVDISVDKSSFGAGTFQGMVSYSHLGGGVDSLRESSEPPDEPLKPCPSCGRQFFAYSRWPRHVAVCDNKRQQINSRGGGSVSSISSFRFPSGNANRLPQTALEKSTELGGTTTTTTTTTTATKLTRTNTSEKRKSLGASYVEPSIERRPLSASNRGRDAMEGPNFVRTSTYSSETFAEEDSQVVDDRVPCPSCGRRFATHVAERHIPHCRERSEGNPPIRL
ncbi:zinc-finger of a C2HC-type [Trypanosoma brucei equiperdum]|uniref:Zinc-finger of a C2HC-type n=1 Tax=Trypanosoma brucei equiperdum TaxID=630700 RepID=A0A3L6KV16_9TRYP|nr:zinc-finger of a C2HC-type [Trypanosoma brucei equiperdum]